MEDAAVPTSSEEPDEGQSGLATRRAGRRNATDPRSDRRWNDILVGAAAVFRRIGYGTATLENVAEEVGLNRASLYYYVSTKAELLVEILREPILGMTSNLMKIMASDVTYTEKLKQAIAAHMNALAESYPDLFVFLAEHLHLLTIGDPNGDIVANARRYGDLFTELIIKGQESGEFRATVHPRIAMMGIVGMCNWTHRWYRVEGELTLPEIGQDFTEMVMNGFVIPA